MSVCHAIKGFETHLHDTAAEARECTSAGGPDLYWALLVELHALDFDPDAAYERHLETAGSLETAAQDAYEARNNVISFSDAWDLAGR